MYEDLSYAEIGLELQRKLKTICSSIDKLLAKEGAPKLSDINQIYYDQIKAAADLTDASSIVNDLQEALSNLDLDENNATEKTLKTLMGNFKKNIPTEELLKAKKAKAEPEKAAAADSDAAAMMKLLREMRQETAETKAEISAVRSENNDLRKDVKEVKKQNEEIIEQNKGLQVELAITNQGFQTFALSVLNQDQRIFISASHQLEGPQKERLLMLTDGKTPVKLDFDGATDKSSEKASRKRKLDQMTTENTSGSNGSPNSITDSYAPTFLTQQNSKKQKTNDTSKSSSVELTEEQNETFKTFKLFCQVMINSLRYTENGGTEAVPEANGMDAFSVRTNLIDALVSEAMNSSDQSFKLLVQPWIFAILISKYCTDLISIKNTLETELNDKRIPSHSRINELFDEIVGLTNNDQDVITDAKLRLKNQKQNDELTLPRMESTITAAEAEHFQALYTLMRNLDCFKDLTAETRITELRIALDYIFKLQILKKNIEARGDDLSGLNELYGSLSSACNATKTNLQSLSRLESLRQVNAYDSIPEIKALTVKIIDALMTQLTKSCESNSFTAGIFTMSTYLTQWRKSNEAALNLVRENLSPQNDGYTTPSSTPSFRHM